MPIGYPSVDGQAQADVREWVFKKVALKVKHALETGDAAALAGIVSL